MYENDEEEDLSDNRINENVLLKNASIGFVIVTYLYIFAKTLFNF
jgi:hypothetical protein